MEKREVFHIGEPIRNADCIGICADWVDGEERGEETIAEVLPTPDNNETAMLQACLFVAAPALLAAVKDMLRCPSANVAMCKAYIISDERMQALRDAVAMTVPPLKVGDVVKYAKPADGEDGFRFALVELRGTYALCELICNWTVRPIESLKLTDIVRAEEKS